MSQQIQRQPDASGPLAANMMARNLHEMNSNRTKQMPPPMVHRMGGSMPSIGHPGVTKMPQPGEPSTAGSSSPIDAPNITKPPPRPGLRPGLRPGGGGERLFKITPAGGSRGMTR